MSVPISNWKKSTIAGGKDSIFFCTKGAKTADSIICTPTKIAIMYRAVTGPSSNPTKAAGISASVGPKLGMKESIPAINAKINQSSIPKISKAIAVKTKTKSMSNN
ncbi:hypothetical protein D3C86_1854380 [compost metagenome]